MTPVVPVESEAVTTGELGRRLEKFESTMTGTLGTVLDKLDNRPDWADVRRIEAGLSDRIKKLEDWQAWAGRLIIGAVILAVLGAVLVTRTAGA